MSHQVGDIDETENCPEYGCTGHGVIRRTDDTETSEITFYRCSEGECDRRWKNEYVY